MRIARIWLRICGRENKILLRLKSGGDPPFNKRIRTPTMLYKYAMPAVRCQSRNKNLAPPYPGKIAATCRNFLGE